MFSVRSRPGLTLSLCDYQLFCSRQTIKFPYCTKENKSSLCFLLYGWAWECEPAWFINYSHKTFCWASSHIHNRNTNTVLLRLCIILRFLVKRKHKSECFSFVLIRSLNHCCSWRMFDLAIRAYYFIQRESDSGGCAITVANPQAIWKEHLQVHGVHEGRPSWMQWTG